MLREPRKSWRQGSDTVCSAKVLHCAGLTAIGQDTDLRAVYPKETYGWPNKHMKRCSMLLIIREMSIKSTVRYHFTQVRMAIIKKSMNDKCWRGCGEKGALLHCWWKLKLIQPLWWTVRRLLKNLGIKLPYGPTMPLLDIYPEETIIEKDTCTPMFIATVGHRSNLDVYQQMNG